MGTQIRCLPACPLWMVGSSKGQWPLPALVSGGKLPPHLLLALLPNNSVLSHMSLVPFRLLPYCWSSEGVSPSKFVCGPFKRKAWGSRRPPSPSASIPSDFYSQGLWGLLFLVLEPPVGGLGPFTPQGDLHSQDIPPNFKPPNLGVGPAHCSSLPLLPVGLWLLLNSLVKFSSTQPDFRQF